MKNNTIRAKNESAASKAAKPMTTEEFITAYVASRTEGATSGVELARYFISELQEAMCNGRICTLDRMIVLYRVVREINDETIARDRYWAKREERAENRRLKKLTAS